MQNNTGTLFNANAFYIYYGTFNNSSAHNNINELIEPSKRKTETNQQ